MRKIVVFFLGFNLMIFAQNNKGDAELEWFEELSEITYEGDYMTAYLGFGQFLEKFPDSELAPRALFNQGYLLRELGRGQEAKRIFERIIEEEYNEYENYGGIMEQYTLYKNRSAKHLAEIFIEEENFVEALKYIKMFDNIYPYKHFCGNELEADAIYTDVMYAKTYHGLGKLDKAIKKLLPHLFYNGLASNNEVMELLSQYLPQLYSNDEVKQFLQEGIQNFKVKDKNYGTFQLLGVKIPVYTYQFYGEGEIEFVSDEGTKNAQAIDEIIKSHPIFEGYFNN
ncbi:tetratricopeptide repeat protein [Flagellimonas pelagia]|uniref:Tetratricopeptide repeat protein n=1 Tax=Flagellimonas pelagia TaxID=2306998 RepID=A0A3A1NFD6_9FLAO|nr:tetratricopeptide repeat protein [Allomuricauda maritima]RIV43600.1 hypothetical protein D2V05_12880 [Allomuricauda maritima]TXJ93217.1 tetratricopeptide repeat protein [Allomuricauda maritima]